MGSVPRSRALAACACAVVSFVGCFGPDYGDRQPIAGEIGFQGAPLDQGTIQFAPKGPGASGFAAAEIRDGKFVIPARGGLSPGLYEVRISSGAPGVAAAEAMPGESGPLAQERIPAQYNINTTLEHRITAEGPNDFDLSIP